MVFKKRGGQKKDLSPLSILVHVDVVVVFLSENKFCQNYLL